MLLDEVETLLEEVACFLQACCDAQHQGSLEIQNPDLEGVRLKDRLSFGLFGDKNVQVHFNPFVQNEVFDPLDQSVQAEQALPSFNFLSNPAPPPPILDESDDNEDNFEAEPSVETTISSSVASNR